ncbi:hypothetical protein CRUP_006076 [Coryphaenoides rupestris]|nr:hypothetical protein CRUP_006076 [Coryphaenoides rupestris]
MLRRGSARGVCQRSVVTPQFTKRQLSEERRPAHGLHCGNIFDGKVVLAEACVYLGSAARSRALKVGSSTTDTGYHSPRRMKLQTACVRSLRRPSSPRRSPAAGGSGSGACWLRVQVLDQGARAWSGHRRKSEHLAEVAVVAPSPGRRTRPGAFFFQDEEEFVDSVGDPVLLRTVLPRQQGRVAIVTGGARGMGFETARHLAGLGMHVLIAEFQHLDLASLKSVRQFVQRFKVRRLPLHVLVNNAVSGVLLRTFHYGLNFLGHFLLTNLLLDTLARSGTRRRCARVVMVASATHYGGTLDLANLHKRGCYSAHGAYAQSKVALVLFARRLQERASSRGLHLTSNAVDPGMVDTALYDFLCGPAETPAEGASTLIYAAAASEMEGVGGRYLYNGEDRPSADCTYDAGLQAALWESSCALVGLPDA